VRKWFKLCSEVAHLYETEFPTHPPPSMRTKKEVLTAEYMRERELKWDDFCNIFVVFFIARSQKVSPELYNTLQSLYMYKS